MQYYVSQSVKIAGLTSLKTGSLYEVSEWTYTAIWMKFSHLFICFLLDLPSSLYE